MSRQALRSVAGEEFETSYTALMDASPHVVLRHFLARHDQLIEQLTADSGQAKACVKGCAWCCHLKVVADAVEVFSMVDYVRSELDADQIEQIIKTARHNIEEARHLSHEQHSTINQKCPLLLDNACVAYPVRTIRCRNFHAVDDSSCRASYDNPEDLSILNENIPELYIASMGSGDGFLAALHTCDFDDRLYDLNGAFVEALENPACKQRYDAGERAFITARYDND